MKDIFRTLKSNRKLFATLIFLVLFLILSVVLCINLSPIIQSLTENGVRESFQKYIENMGFGGVLVMLGIQILQVVIAFIPGEPVEILMGILFGTFGGLAVSMIGCAVASALVFFAMRKFGKPLFEVFFDTKKMERFRFLQNSQKLELLIFLLFFIPGTPKDVLTYFAPLTPIKMRDFLLISTFARVPSIITSTYAGSTILEGNLLKTVIAFSVTAVLGIAGILIGNRLTDRKNKEDTK